MTTNLLGKKLGQYKLISLVGEGGIATVYKAFQQSLDRWVAVKVLHSDDQNILARFEREAKAVANLRHRNILMVYEYGIEQDFPYIVMELVEEGTLENYLTGQPMDWARAVNIAIYLSDALHYAHQHGLIHRDIKPSNILMPQEDWPLLADFGLVKVSDDDKALTATGMIMGTPSYIAPEQARGDTIGIHADMYALGVILFEMVAGRLPFAYENANYLMLAHIQEDPPSPRDFNPNCPSGVEEIILKTLEKSPEDRYSDMESMGAALRRALRASAPHYADADSATIQVNNEEAEALLDTSDNLRPQKNEKPQKAQEVRLLLPDKNVSINLVEPIEKNGLIIGRTYGANKVDIDLGPHGAAEMGISRRHSRLTKRGNTWHIDDLSSLNGTLVNNVKLSPDAPVPLKNGDVIQLGRMYMIFLTNSD